MLFEAKDFYRETANENKNTHFKPEKKTMASQESWFSKASIFQTNWLYIEVSVDGCLMAWMLL